MPNVDVKVEVVGLDELTGKLQAVDQTVKDRIHAVLEFHKEPATAYMKTNAPWTDRTGAARAGLHSEVEVTEEYQQLVMAHTVYYGLYLETRFSHAYSVLEPTVDHFGPLIMSRLQGLLDKMGKIDGQAPAINSRDATPAPPTSGGGKTIGTIR